MKKEVHLGWKDSVLPWKRGFILDRKVSVLSRKRACFELKKKVCCKKGVIFKLVNKDGYYFFQWVSEPGSYMVTHIIWRDFKCSYIDGSCTIEPLFFNGTSQAKGDKTGSWLASWDSLEPHIVSELVMQGEFSSMWDIQDHDITWKVTSLTYQEE